MSEIDQIRKVVEEKQINEIVAYSRKSREIDLEGLQKHRDIMRDLASKLGVAISFKDEAETSEHLNRPVLNQLREDIKRKKYRCLMVYRIDRLSRKVTDTERLLKEFDFNDLILIEAHKEKVVDYSEYMGIKLEAMMSDLYLEQSKIVLNAGKKQAVALYGNHLGEPPLGYTYNKETKKLDLNKDSWVIQQIFDMYIKGHSTHSIAVKLNKQGLTTRKGGAFTGKGIWTILHNEKYIGTQIYGKQEWYKDGEGKVSCKDRPRNQWVIYENAHEPIVKFEVFERVKQLMDENRDAPVGKRKTSHPLTQLVRCEKCGRFMSMITRKYPNKSVVMVRSCCNKDYTTGSTCGNKGIESEAVINILKKDLWENVRPQILKVERELAKDKKRYATSKDSTELKGLLVQQAEINKQIDNLIDLQLDIGKSDKLVKKMKSLEVQLNNITEQVEILKEISGDADDNNSWVGAYLENAKDLISLPFTLKSGSNETVNLFLKKYVESVNILDGEIVSINYTKEIDQLLSL